MKFVAPTVTPKGLARRVPPAIFPSLLGLFGLGLGWRQAGMAFDLPGGAAEAFLGGATLLYLFALGAYLVKLVRRPGAILDDLRTLPGRLGLSAMLACLYLQATVLAPYLPDPARWLVVVALVLHGGLIALILWTFFKGPAEARRYSPAGHLYFVSPIIGAVAAAQAGYDYLAMGLGVATLGIGAGVWAWGADRLRQRPPAAALRPLLALHLAPAALAGMLAMYLGLTTVATIVAALTAVLFASLGLAGRWLTEGGFAPLWSVVTYPLAAAASLWLLMGGAWSVAGALVLIATTFVNIAIAFRVLKLWAGGQLAVKTNAAIA